MSTEARAQAQDLNADDYLIDMITNDRAVNGAELRRHFNIPRGKAGNKLLVKNPFLNTRTGAFRPDVTFKYIVSHINNKIKTDGVSNVVSAIRQTEQQGRLSRQPEPEPESEPEPEPESEPEPEPEEAEEPEPLQAEPEPDVTARPRALPSRVRTGGLNILRNAKSMTDFKRGLVSLVTGGKYIGSGTPLVEMLRQGERPNSVVDAIAMEHDIAYTLATSDQNINDADDLFIRRLNDEFTRNPFQGSNVILSIAGTAISAKTIVDRLPYSKTERLYADYEANRALSDEVKDMLHAIHTELGAQETLTKKSIDFIFDAEPDEGPGGDQEFLEGLIRDVDEIIGDLGDLDLELEPEPISGPAERGRIQSPRFHPPLSARPGHSEQIKKEQTLQKLKAEDEERKMGIIYENNPDDYMSNPVPNHYMRPMFATQWLDIAKLQQYQTPEYIKKEKKIWDRNWQTPFQFGAGTEDNSVKDISNLTERLARLEHHLRYDLASKTVPNDQSAPGFYYGEPMKRTGRFQTVPTDIERWNDYVKLTRPPSAGGLDMDKYQHFQRQNEPPHSKTINREKQFGRLKLAREDAATNSQQRIYDEPTSANGFDQSLPKIDIKNDYDRAYYDRRIRKRRR
jgi:hypothetical protein